MVPGLTDGSQVGHKAVGLWILGSQPGGGLDTPTLPKSPETPSLETKGHRCHPLSEAAACLVGVGTGAWTKQQAVST
jgi:hypothetical protein